MEPQVQKRIWDRLQFDRIMREDFKVNFTRVDKILAKISGLSAQNPSEVRILNIGIGNAYLEGRMISARFDIYTLDPSTSAVAAIKEKLSLDDVHAKCGWSQDIPFPDDFFDFVVMSEVVEHLTDEIMHQTFNELRRVLKRGGYFVGTVPDNEDLSRNEFTCPYCGKTSHRVGHERTFTIESLRELLEEKFQLKEIFSFRGMHLNRKGILYFHWIDLPYKIVRIFRKNVRSPHQIAFCIFFVARNTRGLDS